jgi:hypothetical protein
VIARVFWGSAVLVAAAQIPRLFDETALTVELLILPIAAAVLFFCGLAFASGGVDTPPALLGGAVLAGPLVALALSPLQVRPPAAELSLHLAGAAFLVVIAAWLSVQHKPYSTLSSLLVAAGGAAGMVAFCRAAFFQYRTFVDVESAGSAIVHTHELTTGFGLGGALLLVAGFLIRRRTGTTLSR